MKLQILVPHYKEEWEEVKPLLDSIAIQQATNFNDIGVIIAADGPESIPFSEELFKEYPFEIKYVSADKHIGVSATRNLALDNATADYVMFCDADDMFLTVNALYTILQLIDTQDFDTLVSAFMEEQKTKDVQERMNNGSAILEATFGPQYKSSKLPEFIYLPHEVDSTFVHGKVHRRKYLLKNNIRFNDNLTVHEDSYFNILAQQLCSPERAKYWPSPFYLWKWRDNSVCRHDPKYLLKTFNNMLETTDALIDQFIKRGYEEKAKAFCASCIYDTYYTMNKPDWIEETNAEYRESTEKKFKEWFNKHHDLWDSLDNQVRVIISEQQRQRHVSEGMLMEAFTLDQWLEKIKSL